MKVQDGEDAGLASLQGWMQNALVFPGQADRAEIERLIEPSERLTAPERLAIYQRGYSLRLLKCMQEQFPALCHALGEDLFNEFARQYLQARPSESYTLYDLGRRFPGYLEDTRPDRDGPEEAREIWVDFMVDLARFERAVFVMFDAPGNEGKPFADEDTPDERLVLQPCFELHVFRFPVNLYYHHVRAADDPPFPPRQRSLVALLRKDYLTRTIPLADPHFRFLQFLVEGSSVPEALKKLAAETGRSEDELRAVWGGGEDRLRERWIGAGFFVARE